MAEKDITTSIEATETDVSELKKAHYQQAGSDIGKATRIAPPIAEQPAGLNQELLNMLKIGKTYANFQGIDRCIKVLEPNTPNAHHCGAMIVSNLTLNQKLCSQCDKIKDINAKPKVINSSMIRLTQKELEECGLTVDPLLNAKSDPLPKPKKVAKNPAKVAESKPRRTPLKTPNSIKLEMTMQELKENRNVVAVMLRKALEAIYELPVSNFREAEEIRVVKDRVEEMLSQQGEPGGE